MISRKGQTWGLDLIMAVFIFVIGVFVFLIYSINYSCEATETFEKLSYDGEIIMKSVLSEGSPKGWDESNVKVIGVISDNKINQTKLEQFYNFTLSDYDKTKIVFNIKYDYYLTFKENITLHGNQVEGIGHPNISLNNIDSNNLIKITRFSIYNNTPATIYLYVWE